MITTEMKVKTIVPEELRNLPVVEYPEEEMAEAREILRETLEDFYAGKIVPQTADEFALKHGIPLDDDAEESDVG
ncbi:hypothetical protein R80B4_02616 [Fibrobacteres bacterium R8-0-B4]